MEQASEVATSGGSGGSDAGNFIAALNAAELDDLKAAARVRRYPRGAIFFNEGDPSDRVLVITKGRVKVSYTTDEGREVVLAIREPGDLLGEMSALDGGPTSAMATAMEPVEAIVLSTPGFKSFLESHPRVAVALLEMLSSRLRDATSMQIELSAYDTAGRVAKRLVELADRFGEASDEGLRIKRLAHRFARRAGVGRELLLGQRRLQTLRGRGLIETARRGILIKDADELRRRARRR